MTSIMRCLAFVLAIFSSTAAFAGPLPEGFRPGGKLIVYADGERVEVPMHVESPRRQVGQWSRKDVSGEWVLEVAVKMDPDPEIVYAASALDLGAPSTFGFIFSQAIAPTATPGAVQHSHSGLGKDF